MFGAISFIKYKNNGVELGSPCFTHMFYLKKSELCSVCFMQDLYQYHIHNITLTYLALSLLYWFTKQKASINHIKTSFKICKSTI